VPGLFFLVADPHQALKEKSEMADLTGTYYAAEGREHGWGAQLLVGNGVVGSSPQTYEAVAEVVRIRPGGLTTATFTRTHLRSPNAHVELQAALRSSEAWEVECNYRPTHESQSQAGGGSGSFISGGMLGLNIARTNKDFVIRLASGFEFPIQGFCSGYTIGEIGSDDGISLTMTITPLGDYSGDLP
jgi:hypothetical protein